jgi:hypothetical protein
VVAVETKRLRHWRDLGETVRAKHMRQARQGADSTRSLLRSTNIAALPEVPVEAVLVLWGGAVDDFNEGPVRLDDTLTVLRAGDLSGWLAERATGPIAVDVAERALSALDAYALRRDRHRRGG